MKQPAISTPFVYLCPQSGELLYYQPAEDAAAEPPETVSETPAVQPSRPEPPAAVQDIGYAKAKSIALNHAGVSESKAYDMEIELDDEDGTLVYEVEFKSGGMEYSYEINAATGAILKHETELDD